MPTDVLVRPDQGSDVGTSGPDRSRRFGRWVRANRVDLTVVFGLMVVLGSVHAIGMYDFPARFDDEGAYMSQTWAVLERFDLAHYTYWYDHPPLGWLILAAYTGLTGGLARAPYGVAAGREAMLVFHLLSVGLLYLLARRVGMRRPFAVLAVLFFGLSPLGIFFHRMVLLDNIATPFLLAGFVLFLSPRRRMAAHVLGAAALACAVLIREIFVLLVPFAVWLYWKKTDPENRRYSLALTGTTFFGIVLLYPIFALLRGELLPSSDRVSLFGAIAWQLFERRGSGSVLDPSSPAGEVAGSWLTLDPWILVLGAICGVIALLVPRLRWVGVIVVLQGLMLLRPGYLPVMYILPVIPFLCLAVAGVLDAAWPAASSRSTKRFVRWSRRGLVGAALALLLVVVGPSYRDGVARAHSFDADEPFAGATQWLDRNLEDDDILFVDGALWLDLVEGGHPPENTIWFYKLDSDPGVELPGGGGWEEVDYLVASEVVRNSLYDLGEVEQALQHSEPVVTFGSGEGRVEIRRIEPGSGDQ